MRMENAWPSHGYCSNKTRTDTSINKANYGGKKVTEESWTSSVEEYAELKVGENTFEIVGEPSVEEGKYGKRLHVPTNIGVWRISLNSPIARELKQIATKQGRLASVTVTVAKTGEGKDTRYSLVKVILSNQKKHETPPRNQMMLNLESLTPEQQTQLERILKPQQPTETPQE